MLASRDDLLLGGLVRHGGLLALSDEELDILSAIVVKFATRVFVRRYQGAQTIKVLRHKDVSAILTNFIWVIAALKVMCRSVEEVGKNFIGHEHVVHLVREFNLDFSLVGMKAL